MSIFCDINKMIISFFSQHGYRVISNKEYDKKIKEAIRDVCELRKKDLIDNDSFEYLMRLIASKLIENKLDSKIPFDPYEYKWIMRER